MVSPFLALGTVRGTCPQLDNAVFAHLAPLEILVRPSASVRAPVRVICSWSAIASATPFALFADPIGGILLAINLRPSSAARRRHFTTASRPRRLPRAPHDELKRHLGWRPRGWKGFSKFLQIWKILQGCRKLWRERFSPGYFISLNTHLLWIFLCLPASCMLSARYFSRKLKHEVQGLWLCQIVKQQG